MTDEPQDLKIKRLHMRSMRRGIKEMDLILSSYAAARLPQMDAAALDHYDRLLDENDHDLYQWVSGQTAAKAEFTQLVNDIRQTIDNGLKSAR